VTDVPIAPPRTATKEPDPVVEVAEEAPRRSRRWWLVALVGLLSVPFLVALGVLHHPRWYPILDWAQTEIRIRDVTGGHPPLIGLAGRIGPFGPNGGSHPGPISFYLLWPMWALFGGQAYGMYAGNVVLDIAAVALSVWIGYRRGGMRFAIAIALILVVLMRAYGPFMLTLPWNPYLPVLWWFVVLLSVWSLLADDVVMLPVAVFAGSFCVQTHISYLGLVSGLGVLTIAGALWHRWRGPADERATKRDLWVYGSIAAVLFVLLWIPPFVDEFTNHPANLSTIRDYFSNPPDPPIGLHSGLTVLLAQLNPAKLFGAPLVTDGAHASASNASWPGVLFVLAWLGSVVVAFRMKVRALLRLDLVLGVALVTGLISAARIFGKVWFYLLLWATALCALMLFAIAWTIFEIIRRRTRDDDKSRLAARGTALLVGLIVVVTAIFTVSAAKIDVMTPRLNSQLGALTAPTVSALKQLEAGGQKGTWLVTWLPEPQDIGAEGYGLLNELLRNGFDVKAEGGFRPGATAAHVSDDFGHMVGQVHLATGVDIARWRADPRFREIAYYDPRTPAERVEFDALHAQAVDGMKRDGAASRLHELDDNTFVLLLDNTLSPSTQKTISRMLDLGFPAAVFIGPAGVPPASPPG
jgi:hypothetical protein